MGKERGGIGKRGNALNSIAAFLLLIGLLVFVHELGHFLVAKWCGVRVEKFALGFGPALAGFTYGETEYKICLLPLGGYVKMSGETEEPAAIVENIAGGAQTPFRKGDRITAVEGVSATPQSRWKEVVLSLRENPGLRKITVERDGKEMELTAGYGHLKSLDAYFESEYPRSFSKKSVARRMSIVTAGPLMNFALPFVLLPAAFMAGMYVPAHTEYEPVVRRVADWGENGKLLKGDRIISVNGKTVENWGEVSAIAGAGADDVSVEIERKGGRIRVQTSRESLKPELAAEPHAAVVGEVAVGSPAYKAGIKSGDMIESVGGEKIRDWSRMANIIRQSAGEKLELSVVRKGERLKIHLVPSVPPGGRNAVIGITMHREQTLKRFGFAESVVSGVKRAARMTAEVVSLFFGFLLSVIGGEMSFGEIGKSVAGPLFIAKMSGAVAQQGIANLLVFASFISINLAIVNLLPIPVLDGGHLVYLTIESFRGKPLSRATLETVQRIGFFILIAIMLIATYNDISNLRGEIMDWLGGLGGIIG